ncbi:hypothetical protein [Streptomyces sp. CBMA29]|uniref:hypothetical protein n=1 Tax=Streptomyces sp. CBMA29 TaxID=1896314 RepID=UPI001661CAFB|nr:hypothetical protein [Streptomyces sp. CBMA29]MBD0733994.1 hypothetical protein [Streptomyces sp. CBMA29]
MTTLEGFPLPVTAKHDADGNHVPPFIPEWHRAADPSSAAYDPNRVVRGSEVERDQNQKQVFHDHLEEHRRRGEPAVVVEGDADWRQEIHEVGNN